MAACGDALIQKCAATHHDCQGQDYALAPAHSMVGVDGQDGASKLSGRLRLNATAPRLVARGFTRDSTQVHHQVLAAMQNMCTLLRSRAAPKLLVFIHAIWDLLLGDIRWVEGVRSDSSRNPRPSPSCTCHGLRFPQLMIGEIVPDLGRICNGLCVIRSKYWDIHAQRSLRVWLGAS